MKGTIIAEFHAAFKQQGNLNYDDTVYLWVGAVIMGIFGGLCGALFINVNTRLNYVRRRHLTTKFRKTLECTIFIFVTANFIYWTPYFFNRCTVPTHTVKTDA